MFTEAKIVYFDKLGQRNTDEVLRIARKRADELGIKTVVVASVRGYTAVKAMDIFQGMKVVVITAHTGWYHQPNVQHFTEAADARRVDRAARRPTLTEAAPPGRTGLARAPENYILARGGAARLTLPLLLSV